MAAKETFDQLVKDFQSVTAQLENTQNVIRTIRENRKALKTEIESVLSPFDTEIARLKEEREAAAASLDMSGVDNLTAEIDIHKTERDSLQHKYNMLKGKLAQYEAEFRAEEERKEAEFKRAKEERQKLFGKRRGRKPRTATT